jgi:hypothetical protein
MVACNMQRAGEGSRVTGWEDSGAKEDRSGAENWRLRLGSAETRNNVQAEANEARSRRRTRGRWGRRALGDEDKHARTEADEPTKPLENERDVLGGADAAGEQRRVMLRLGSRRRYGKRARLGVAWD